jgi:RNA polymerase sigma factor (TIGR02999 family)
VQGGQRFRKLLNKSGEEVPREPSSLEVTPMSEVTRILSAIEQGEPHAAEQLLPLVYAELRKLAAQKLAQEKPGQTLQATGLVHEAYLRLVRNQDASWEGRRHFFVTAARAMREILIEQARRKASRNHGGQSRRVELAEGLAVIEPPAADLLALDEAIGKLREQEPRLAEVVMLRYYTGRSPPRRPAADCGSRCGSGTRPFTCSTRPVESFVACEYRRPRSPVPLP